MPLTIEQARRKDSVLAEIRREYPGTGATPRVWDANKFSFSGPSNVWLNNFGALQRLKVDVKYQDGGYNVRLTGDAGNGAIYTDVGFYKANG